MKRSSTPRRRMRALVLLLPVVFALGLVAAESYGRCASPGYPALGVVQFGEDPAAAFFVDDRTLLLGDSVWIYQEANDHFDSSWSAAQNLQRGTQCQSGLPDGSWPGSCIFDSPGRQEICMDVTPYGFDYLIV